ncbi:MAG: TIGR03668 family PPOX class F420-dependent oxidoreductase [Chloroflexi bacterium]|nr:TIGR03668 family PPOX class F420-dependent oxidoreductase [Chloroflexota bacterium]
MFSQEVADFVANRRVARLATADAGGAPYIVPICFAFDGARIYSAIDLKPKRVGGRALKRIRNIMENPKVAIVIDDYSEDWSELAYVMIRGSADIIIEEGEENEERERAEKLLREKYPQYEAMLQSGCAIIRITPERVVSWGAL